MRRLIADTLHALALASAALAALAMVSIVAIISSSVVMRALGMPLHVTEELVGLLLSVTLLLGLPMVTLKADHVRVALIADNIPSHWRTALGAAALVLSLGFFIWLMKEALPWFQFAFERNLKTQTARLLLYPWMAILPICVALCIAIFAARLTGLCPADHRTRTDPDETGAGT